MSWNPRVTSSNPGVTSSNPRFTSSKPGATSSNLRVTSFKPTSHEFKSANYYINETQRNSLKSSLFPTVISPKLFGNSWGNSYVQLYVPTTPWLRLQQEADWVKINFERRDLNSPEKSHPLPDYFGENYFFVRF